jgi:hypothetical protein
MLMRGTPGLRGKGTYGPDFYNNPIPKVPEGGAGGDALFIDGDKTNDYFGVTGEHAELVGGQGGGGGGVRWDSLNPAAVAFTQSNLPPCKWDAKGGGGGGGAGAVAIHAMGTITITETGKIVARGGRGGRGERVITSSAGGGGGAGSGGVVILHSGTAIILEESSDPDPDAVGATVDVTGGIMGDARESESIAGGPQEVCPIDKKPKNEFCSLSWADGGQGGFGLIQLMVPNPDENLTPPPSEIATAKVMVGATVFDADSKTGTYGYTKNGYITYERVFLTYDPAAYPITIPFGELDIPPYPLTDHLTFENGPVADPYSTLANISEISYGLSKWIDLGAAVRRPPVGSKPAPAFPGFRGTDSSTGIVITKNGYVENYWITGPGSNDIEVKSPLLELTHFIDEDNEVKVEFQGAHAAAPGLSVPGDDKSDWTADISELSGYQFIRYRVALNVAKSGNFSLSSIRPQVDKIRIRVKY